ncbi:MAG: S46 family peptidase, partial [Bacteroidota bacterium]
MNRLFSRSLVAVAIAFSFVVVGCSSQNAMKSAATAGYIDLDTVKAGQFDTGKMWTFDFPPVQYFAQTYHFNPTKEWFDKARLAALRLPGCSAAFVSEDGLIMTNHHCARGSLQRVQKEGEKLVEAGFYAHTLDEERKAPIWVDQLIVMDDVTKEVQAAFDAGISDSAKTANRAAKIAELQRTYAEKYKKHANDSMVFSVVSFYNGGRYSLYGYKRYTDVRLVFAPEAKAAFFGGDPDNFTYPRYDFDCSFFRVYDNGKPLKTADFFRFSKNGAGDGEVVFVVGNPGTTNRLMTMAQLQTLRDDLYPMRVDVVADRERAMEGFVEKHPDMRLEYMNQIFGVANSRKAISGYLSGLRDPYLMAKKKDFEAKFQSAVLNNPTLKNKYGNPWKEIAEFETQRRALTGEAAALEVATARSQYLVIAAKLVQKAEGGPRSGFGEGRPPAAAPGKKAPIFPEKFQPEIETPLLADQLRFMKEELGDRNTAFNNLLAGRTPEQAAGELAKTTIVGMEDKVKELEEGKPEDILNSSDPLIKFVVQSRTRSIALQERLRDIRNKEAEPTQLLGRALYEVYGTSIPPDATFSLRIADGVVQGYPYNGTIAPPFTTFYGMYDRYYSFGKK